MHGTIFTELEKYVGTRLGDGAWSTLLEKSGMAGRTFSLLEEYPDADALALVATASRVTGQSSPDILEDFGAFIADDLLEMFWGVIEPAWRTLDVIENTEQAIHRVVRLKNPGARPPELRVSRPNPEEVLVDYRSARRLCALAKGIVRGLAAHFHEEITVSEPECMLRGNERCLLSVKLVA